MAWFLVKSRVHLHDVAFSYEQDVFKRRDSSVGIALGYGLDDRGSGFRFPAEAGNFSLHHRVQNGSGDTQPPIQWVPGALSLGVKQLAR
jgi:hypothetical protein